ncbi:MAG: hypothetical protein PHU71_07040 [Candidatus Gracilibacteria bacterium]|nr:hypothetical protein [Candidatus Gracilibacteria bacterium]
MGAVILMKEIYISLDEEKTIRDYMWSVDEENMENGNRELHIFPKMAGLFGKGTKENPMPEKVQFIQNGCSYGPDFNYSNVIFDIGDLFDQDAIDHDASDIGNYSEVRSSAIDDFKNSNGIDDIDEMSEEMKEKLQKQVDEWVQNAVEYDESIVRSNIKEEISDIDKGIVYKIIWT